MSHVASGFSRKKTRITVGRHGGSPYAVTKRSRSQETDKPFNTVPTDDRHTGCLSRRGEPPVVCSGFSADRQNIMENSNRTPGLSVRLRSVALGVALIATAAVVQVRVAAQDLTQLVSTATPAQAAPLIYNNRQITVFRAAVLSRTPAERAQAASDRLDRIVNDGQPGTVSSRPLQGASILSVGSRDVFAIVPLDVDTLAGETLETTSAAAIGHLQQAVDEAIELRTPRRIATSTAWALLATVIAGILVLVTRRFHRNLVVAGVQDRRTEAQAIVGGRRARQGLAGARCRAEGCHDDFHRPVAVHRLQLADLRPAAVPLHPPMGRIPAIVPARSARLVRHER